MIVLRGLFIFAGIMALKLIWTGDKFERIFWSFGLVVFVVVGFLMQ